MAFKETLMNSSVDWGGGKLNVKYSRNKDIVDN